MNERELQERQRVIDEARTWLGTPYRLNAKIKGVGVDCGTFLIAAFSGSGLIPDVDLGVMMQDFHLHRGDEVYLRWILKFCRPVSTPEPGDIVLYRYGRVVSHGALVVDWPRVIHAPAQGVLYANATDPILATRQSGIFSFWGGDRT